MLKTVLKVFVFILFIFLFVDILYLNLGKFLDATLKPIKRDLLVCLGGGDYKLRVEKTLELYKKGYDNSHTIILTGYVNSSREIAKGIVEDKRLSYLKKHLDSLADVVLVKSLKNTAQEVLFVKKYMINHHLKSATFVTEAPHSRRILFFTKLLSVEGDNNLSFGVVADAYKNWNTNNYYKDKYARNYAFSEVIKVFYGFFTYGILEKIGLLQWFEKNYSSELKKSKKNLAKEMNFISS